jgi:hypothetical protein
MALRLVSVVSLVVLTAAGCGAAMSSADGASMSPDGGSPGMCGAEVPAEQACNTLANAADQITPTCVSGTIPTGTGGTIVDGTYVLTSQTYYQDSTTCVKPSFSETITIAGDCMQGVVAGVLSGNFSGRIATQGNTFTSTLTCQRIDADAAVIMNVPTQTYTATNTTLTLFSVHSSINTFDVAVFTRR